MARDTQLIVLIPGDMNERLASYKFILEDKGVRMSKSDMAVQLIGIGLVTVMKELEDIKPEGDE